MHYVYDEQDSDVTVTSNTTTKNRSVTLPIISETISLTINIPETTTHNNHDNNQQIKQEPILSDQCEVSYNGIQENNIKCKN